MPWGDLQPWHLQPWHQIYSKPAAGWCSFLEQTVDGHVVHADLRADPLAVGNQRADPLRVQPGRG